MNEYKWSKKKLFNLSTKTANSLIFNYDDPYLHALAFELDINKSSLNSHSENDEKVLSEIKLFSVEKDLSENEDLNKFDCAFIKDGFINLRLKNKLVEICSIEEIPIKGKHNLSNTLASLLACADFTDLNQESFIERLKNFKAVPHRLEYVSNINGKDFYNDSKATNPSSAIKSLEAFNQSIAIIGGKDKNLDLNEFLNVVKEKTEFVYLIGELKNQIAMELAKIGFENFKKVSDLNEAVNLAINYKSTSPVILAPASSSFDMFNSFEERGEIFKEIVLSKALKT